MKVGFTNSGFYVNSATGSSRDALYAAGIGVDWAGCVPLLAIAQEAQAQGVNVTVENVAGTLTIAKVSIRTEIQEQTGYTKQHANQIMRDRKMLDSAPLRIAGQPAYTDTQLAVRLAEHDAQACRNKARQTARACSKDDCLEGTPAADDKC